MRKYKNLYHKKILLTLVVFFCFFLLSNVLQISADTLTQEEKKLVLNNKISNIYSKLDSRSFHHQTSFYKILKEKISEKKVLIKDTEKLLLIQYIEESFDEKYAKYKRKQEELLKEERSKVKKHTTLILKFTRNGNHKKIISENLQKIKQTGSVFLFKKGNDLSRNDIQTITNELLKINKELLVFIDQEGGWINRYIEFEKGSEVDSYFSNTVIDKKIRSIFPKKYGYFPSMENIGKIYDTFKAEEEKKYFLEKIAYIRLQTLKNHGINTYGLVLDLNRGNPVISNYSRSFSKHQDKYKKLVDAFTLASRQTGVVLYFKHFPGHGEGKIDSHKGILNLAGKENYVKENIELFQYALESNQNSGLMIGHMYITDTLKTHFNSSVAAANFILTDDLGMQGYKQAKGKIKKDLFFTTDAVINNTKLITIDSMNVSGIK